MYSKEEYEKTKDYLKETIGLKDEGISPLPDNWKKRYARYIKSLSWKQQLFQGALFPIDPRIISLPYACKYGDDNRLLQDLAYPDRLKPDWEWAKRLVRDNAPRHLYKYRTVNENSINSLKEDTLWMSNAEAFNDPFDCVNLLGFDSLKEVLRKDNPATETCLEFFKGMSQMSNNIQLKFNDISRETFASLFESGETDKYSPEERIKAATTFLYDIEKTKYDFRINYYRRLGWIGCVSEVNDSILMWSYYADSHRGFCIEYDSMEMYESPYIRHNMYPVNYKKEVDEWEDISTGIDWLPLYITLRKSPQWSHEKEWRLVFPNAVKEAYMECENPKGWNLQMPKPTAVYIGAMMLPENQETILDKAKKRGIRAFKEKLNYKKLIIEFEELK